MLGLVSGTGRIALGQRLQTQVTLWLKQGQYAGPLSEVGELRDPTEDTHSIYGDSDLMSSDGRDQVFSQPLPLPFLWSQCCSLSRLILHVTWSKSWHDAGFI